MSCFCGAIIGTCLMLCAATAYAQPKNKIRVTGVVYDNSQNPIEGAVVFLLNRPDSSLVKSSYTNEIGKFELDGVLPGKYLLKSRFIGVEQVQEVAFQEEYNDPLYISLEVSPNMLKEVTVAASRPFLEKKPGMLVINVDNSVIAAGNTAFEVLERAPGIKIDNNDQISMNGKTGMLLAINGKISPLPFSDIANYLRSVPAHTIEQVELINNPGAEYDAAGTAGVINIVLKENKRGTTGSVNASAGYGDFHKLNTSLSLSNVGRKLTLYGTYGYGNNSRYEQVNMTRTLDQATRTQCFDIFNYDVKNRSNHSVRLGADYQLGKRHTLGFNASRLSSRMNSDENNSTLLSYNFIPDSTILTESDETRKVRYATYNMFYHALLGPKNTDLYINADHLAYRRASDESLTNTFIRQPSRMASHQLFRNNNTPSKIGLYSIKADLKHAFSTRTTLRTGLKFSYVDARSQRLFETLQGGMWIRDALNSSDLDYTEQISSGYAVLDKQFKRLSFSAGVRLEQTRAEGISESMDVIDRNYLNFFPSLRVSYDLSDNSLFSFNYSRRINRPLYEDLNPFRYFLDDYSYLQGNPFLMPEYASSYELSYIRSSFSATLEYRFTNDFFLQLNEQDLATGISRLSKQNIDHQSVFGLTINAPVKWSKTVSSDVNLQVSRIGYKLQQQNQSLGNSSAEVILSVKNNFRFTDRLKAELVAGYESAVAYGMFNYKPVYVFDAGLSFSFPGQRYQLNASASDIFNRKANRYRSFLDNPNLFTTEKAESRVVRLSLVYRFGQQSFKPGRNAEPAEESGRINTN